MQTRSKYLYKFNLWCHYLKCVHILLCTFKWRPVYYHV